VLPPNDGNLRHLSIYLCAPELSLFRDMLQLLHKEYRDDHNSFRDGKKSNGATIILSVHRPNGFVRFDEGDRVSTTALAQAVRVWGQGSECAWTAPVAVLAPYQEP
jgi:hypothetical protein